MTRLTAEVAEASADPSRVPGSRSAPWPVECAAERLVHQIDTVRDAETPGGRDGCPHHPPLIRTDSAATLAEELT
jgi:hypothetical protein